MRPNGQYEKPDLFKSCLDQMINLKHPLVLLSHRLNWFVFEQEFGATYHDLEGLPAFQYVFLWACII